VTSQFSDFRPAVLIINIEYPRDMAALDDWKLRRLKSCYENPKWIVSDEFEEHGGVVFSVVRTEMHDGRASASQTVEL
jgi:hypothetical protein